MKHILVIDVPVWDDGRHLCNECPIWNKEHYFCEYDFNMEAKGCPLKPLPQRKKNSIVHQGEVNIDIPIDFLEKIYNQGYNACLEELTGETE